jgi:hypothetical protein
MSQQVYVENTELIERPEFEENWQNEDHIRLPNPTSLVIKIHQTDGCSTRFTQTEPLAIQSLLDHLHPDTVFHHPQIFVADEDSLNVYQTNSIAWIQVIMEGFPDWNFPPSVDHINVITETEFHTLAAHPNPIESGQALFLAVQLDLVNGEQIFYKVYGPKATMLIDIDMSIKSLFIEGRCLMARSPEGGVVLVNAANVLRMRLFPRSPNYTGSVPMSSWSACRLSVDRATLTMRAA